MRAKPKIKFKVIAMVRVVQWKSHTRHRFHMKQQQKRPKRRVFFICCIIARSSWSDGRAHGNTSTMWILGKYAPHAAHNTQSTKTVELLIQWHGLQQNESINRVDTRWKPNHMHTVCQNFIHKMPIYRPSISMDTSCLNNTEKNLSSHTLCHHPPEFNWTRI